MPKTSNTISPQVGALSEIQGETQASSRASIRGGRSRVKALLRAGLKSAVAGGAAATALGLGTGAAWADGENGSDPAGGECGHTVLLSPGTKIGDIKCDTSNEVLQVLKQAATDNSAVLSGLVSKVTGDASSNGPQN
ncbi:hypothetical protein ACSNOI_42635 [Actinomadura kijaniata]|uniref:hypothetical protein n=1 Tax=Actinomadura kijaniata TaxID=46161 RepID=UPI003F1C9FA7